MSRRIYKQEVLPNGWYISSVALEYPMSGAQYETMVFAEGGDMEDWDCERCPSWDDLPSQHEAVKARWEKQPSPAYAVIYRRLDNLPPGLVQSFQTDRSQGAPLMTAWHLAKMAHPFRRNEYGDPVSY